jgi:hypothetical protein
MPWRRQSKQNTGEGKEGLGKRGRHRARWKKRARTEEMISKVGEEKRRGEEA